MLGQFGYILRIFWTCGWAASLYSVLAYGVTKDFPHMGAEMIETLGYAYLLTKLNKLST